LLPRGQLIPLAFWPLGREIVSIEEAEALGMGQALPFRI